MNEQNPYERQNESTQSPGKGNPDDGVKATPPSSHPNLEEAAPRLSTLSAEGRGARPILMMAAIATLLATTTALLFGAIGSRGGKEPTRNPEELVTVPAAPSKPIRTSTVRSQPSAPIPLANLPTSREPTSPQLALIPKPNAERESLLERRKQAGDTGILPGVGIPGGIPGAISEPSAANALVSSLGAGVRKAAAGQPDKAYALEQKDTLMAQGTSIRCALQTRIITDHPGLASCVVTEPVYSFTGKHLLLPKGTKVMGQYDAEPDSGRIGVIWERAITPNGVNIDMESPGVDNLGSAGHPGHYSAHWGSRISAALWISIFSDAFKYAGAKYGPTQTSTSSGIVTQDPFESNTAETIQNIAKQAVRRAANRPATVTINQGTIVSIFVAKDVDFSQTIKAH